MAKGREPTPDRGEENREDTEEESAEQGPSNVADGKKIARDDERDED
jgi:hypothetical protein